MNHPSNAFAALLVLLALAMLAVSSASRSTTVRPPATAQPEAAAADQSPAPAAGRGAVYVLVLPAAEEQAAEEADVATCAAFDACDQAPGCDVPCYATGCGLDRLTGVVYDCEPCFASCDAWLGYDSPCSIAPARVELAGTNAVRLARETAVDCLSHYDPAYDQIVYGSGTPVRVASERFMLPPVRWSEVELAELVELFEGIAGPAGGRSPRQPSAKPVPPRRDLQSQLSPWIEPIGQALHVGELRARVRQVENLRTILLGVQNFLLRQLDRGWLSAASGGETEPVAAASRPVEWSEYAELLDERNADAKGSGVFGGKRSSAVDDQYPPKTPDPGASVRSSRWLLHSAASMLHHAGTWLQDAAVELERAGANLEARQPGNAAR